MGTNLPQGRTQALTWLEGHVNDWITNFAAIGLTSAVVTDLALEIVNSRASFTSVEQIRSQSLATTQDFYAQMDGTHDKASDMIKTIKAFAENNADPASVYLLAGITGANPPSPAPPPEQPVISSANLSASGKVTIEFTGRGASGTAWFVSRQLAGETNFSFLGQADDKSYVDSTLPAGTTTATYTVHGVRGNLSGLPSDPVTFFLGNADAGQIAMAA